MLGPFFVFRLMELQNLQVRLSPADIAAIADAVVQRLANQQHAVSEPAKLFYSERDAAKLLNISAFTLGNWRRAGLVKAATDRRPVSYRQSDLEAIAEFMTRRLAEQC